MTSPKTCACSTSDLSPELLEQLLAFRTQMIRRVNRLTDERRALIGQLNDLNRMLGEPRVRVNAAGYIQRGRD